MRNLKKTAWLFFFVVIIVGLLYASIDYYSYIFSKDVYGEIVGVDRVSQAAAVITTNQAPSAAMFSFAVAIRDEVTGKIFTASSEDRQWGVARVGYCARARFYPYPFWNLEKSGTYFNARMLELFDCKPKAGAADGEAPVSEAPVPVPAATPAGQ